MDLRERAFDLIEECNAIVEFVLKDNLYNEQWFINWQDKLNRISVMDMDKEKKKRML